MLKMVSNTIAFGKNTVAKKVLMVVRDTFRFQCEGKSIILKYILCNLFSNCRSFGLQMHFEISNKQKC